MIAAMYRTDLYTQINLELIKLIEFILLWKGFIKSTIFNDSSKNMLY